jgi:hypothetical protein
MTLLLHPTSVNTLPAERRVNTHAHGKRGA